MNDHHPVAATTDAWVTETQHCWIADWLAEASLDRTAAVVRNVALLGPRSRNGYRYTLEAMQQAVPLYEGRPVFVDHAGAGLMPNPRMSQATPWPNRSVRDYAGQVRHPRFDSGRIRGDLHLAGPNVPWLLDLIAAAPTDIGMSHVVLARRRNQSEEIEQIEQVLSVDIVAFPATTRSFSEGIVPCCARHRVAQEESVPTPEPDPAPPALLGELRRLIALLEAVLRTPLEDRPISPERSSRGIPSAAALRKAFLAAIRGRD